MAGARLSRLVVDLADLTSVRRAAAEDQRDRADPLPDQQRGRDGAPESRTADGLELQLATNHFGPFLLTGLLLPQLVARARRAW